MKVQINLSDDMVKKIDKYSQMMGVSRSSFCGVWLGLSVMTLDQMIENGLNPVISNLSKVSSSILDFSFLSDKS